MVRTKGLEPLTFWFVARCSVQLSYARRAVDLLKETREHPITFTRIPRCGSLLVRAGGLVPVSLSCSLVSSIRQVFLILNQEDLDVET